MNLNDLAKKHDFNIDAIEVLEHGIVVRGVGVKKLKAMREELLESHDKPISCHREEGSSEAFMILWKY